MSKRINHISLRFTRLTGWGCLLTERKLVSKCSSVINMSTSRTLPPSCMYCLGELSLIVGTPANILLPSERDSARSSSRPPPRAKFLNTEERSQERPDHDIGWSTHTCRIQQKKKTLTSSKTLGPKECYRQQSGTDKDQDHK